MVLYYQINIKQATLVWESRVVMHERPYASLEGCYQRFWSFEASQTGILNSYNVRTEAGFLRKMVKFLREKGLY
jgi:hypothetical protein